MRTLPTVYRGIKFRSRTEARWAVFFDEMEIEWSYENEGYQLSTGELYLPDFYFPRGFAGFRYAEVKPIISELDNFSPGDPFPAFERSEKFYQFSRECKEGVILLDGWPDFVPYFSLEKIYCDDGSKEEALMDYMICGGDSTYMGHGSNCGRFVQSGMSRIDIKTNHNDFWNDLYILPVIKAQTYKFS